MEAFTRRQNSLHHRIEHAARQAAKPDLGPAMASCVADELLRLRSSLDDNFDDILQTCPAETIPEHQAAYDQHVELLHTATAHLALRDEAPASSSPVPSLAASGPLRPPRLELPKFSGKLTEWPTFAQLFMDGIAMFPGTSTHKLMLLSNSLEGDARAVISFTNPSPTAFDEAWALLRAKYENEVEIVTSLTQSIFNLPVSTSAAQLETVVDTVRQVKRALATFDGAHATTFSVLVIPFLLTRLSDEAIFAWKQTLPSDKMPPVEHILDFLQLWARNKARQAVPPSPSSAPRTAKPNKPLRCPDCSLEHTLAQCPAYKTATCEERFAKIRQHNLCVNCLVSGHKVAGCRSSNCRTCGKRHHTTLHRDNAPSTLVATSVTSPDTPVLLATAMVQLTDHSGRKQSFRAFIDGGSQSSLITKSAAHRLHLPVQTTPTAVLNALGSSTTVTESLQCQVGNSTGSFSLPVNLLVTTTFPTTLPTTPIPIAHLPGIQTHLPGTMADPQFYAPAAVDLLLGADVYARILTTGLQHHGQLVFQNTTLGWIVFGALPSPVLPRQNPARVVANLTRFWELEELPPTRHLTPEESRVDHYVTSTIERHGGRFQVRMPLQTDPPNLGASRHIALKRLLSLERKFAKDPDFAASYKNVIDEYFTLGHLEPVSHDPRPLTRVAYLPHHAVIRDSTSTKVRIVFDASARTSNGRSLNDCQANGPHLQLDLLPLLLKFRSHAVAITADIEKMYRQINLHENDRDLQRILWRPSPTGPIQDYRLTTVTFGEKAAPYLAVKTLHILADRCPSPEVATILKEDFYVDDLLTGAPTPRDAASLTSALQQILHSAGFSTHKWASNSPEALQQVPIAARAPASPQVLSGSAPALKTLGILWDTITDTFRIQITPSTRSRPWTRRAVLSATNEIYDPLGWLAPSTLLAKLLLQQIVKDSTDWDQPLTPVQRSSWLQWWTQLPSLASVSVPRCLKPPNASVELCGFSDASERAYGAVIYARITSPTGDTICRLVAAKTKVSPLKPITLPRLELLGALLLARLIALVAQYLNVPSLHCYTDSTITLSWLQGDPSRWHTFVANRVAEIQRLVPPDRWQHVKGCDNPADLASRGVEPQLLHTTMWWTGPTWLATTTHSGSTLPPEEPPEQRRLVAVTTIAAPSPDLTALLRRFSSYTKLRRVLMFVMMFLDHRRTSSTPQTAHFQKADMAIARLVQQEAFAHDIAQLQLSKPVPLTSPLASLNPYLDDSNVLRVGGRLRHSQLDLAARHPIILPAKHPVTTLLILHWHQRLLHAGATATEHHIRRYYWILHGPSTIKTILRRCFRCTRCRAQLAQQMMADLPAARALPVIRPFFHCGIDFAGPTHLKTQLARSARTYKAYIALFVCLTTRAIHLELVTALSTDAFMAAFFRFTSRRSVPAHVYSDHGTNFVGAQRELATLVQNHNVHSELASAGVQWHFNPPAAPHFGGLWEAGVKSVKTHLRRILGKTILNYEEYATLLCRTEAVLNSRPLLPISADQTSLDALTPAHFLVGGSLTALPEPDLSQASISRLKRWDLVQKLSQDIWRRWSTEYLSRLQQRPKWWRKAPSLSVGRLVLIHDANRPPLDWRLGRITAVHPGPDHLVRVATLHTAYGEVQRPVHKLCLLPLEDAEA